MSCQRADPGVQVLFQVSPYFRFATVAEASHMAKPRPEEWRNRLHFPMRESAKSFHKNVDAGRERICGYFHNLSIP